MTRRVLTYETPSQLYRTDSVFREHYQDCLHITATSSLKKGLGESLRLLRWIEGPVMTFSELNEYIGGKEWTSPKSQLRQFLELSDVLGKAWEEADASKFGLIQAMERNQLELLKTMRMLAELGISSLNLESAIKIVTKEEKMFLNLMEEMEEVFISDLTHFENFLDESNLDIIMNNWLLDIQKAEGRKAYLKRTAANLVLKQEREAINVALSKRKLILHGFYFITPIQEKIFKALEENYELIFLNCYHKDFPETFESVEFFLGINDNKSLRVVSDPAKVHPVAAKLLNGLEGQEREEEVPSVIEYTDVIQFVKSERYRLFKGTKEIGDDPNLETNTDIRENLFTPRSKEVEEYLNASGLTKPPRKKFTDFPVGQFLYHIHDLKRKKSNIETGEIVFEERLTTDLVKECFSSGILIVDGENMQNHLKNLELLSPLMEGITTFTEWEERFNHLLNEKKYWSSKVKKKNNDAFKNRIHEFHSFPINQLSYFALTIEEVNILKKGVDSLKEINESLFTGWENEKVKLEDHLKKIENLILNKIENYFQNEEKSIVESLIGKMQELKDDNLYYSMKDIANGLKFFLGGELDDLSDDGDDDFESMTGLEAADAAPFLLTKNVHLAFADQESLPLGQDYNVWPLTDDSLENLSLSYSELRLLKERKKRNRGITRYLLYILFASANDIRLSYVKSMGKNSKLKQTMYFDLLGCEVVRHIPETSEESQVVEIKEAERVPMIEWWPETFKREAQICPKRASFSYILNKQGTFTSEFHHGFLFGHLHYILPRVMKAAKSERDLETKVDSWFPQWSSLKKNLIKEYVQIKYPSSKFSRGPIVIDEENYSKGLFYLHLLPTSKSGFKDELYKEKEIDLNQPRPGKHCMYCPHLNNCKEGSYSIDRTTE